MGGDLVRERVRPSRLLDVLQILVVEDNVDDIVLIEAALEGAEECRCEVVRDGDEAMAYLRRRGKYASAPQPGVVLLDLNLPRKNGLEVLRELKADAALCHIPVIVLTTSNRSSDVLASYTDGASGFLTKPAGFEEFRVLIRGFVTYWTQVSRIPRGNPA